ncbi:LPXTG cell wall anchor domain-containing protein [Streptomyces sp. NPDC017993]|uniref:LPXTG cell wall anchor domain-containing protein n=1 Tax=Streptomyces sp. NPDC017993 TaxID=3365027 RepID=UPI003798F117
MHHHKVKEHKPKERQQTPPKPVVAPKPVNHPHSAPAVKPALAKTGGEGTALAIAASAGLLAGGILLYRRGREAAARG